MAADAQNYTWNSRNIVLDSISVNMRVPCTYFHILDWKEQWGRLGRSCRAQGAEGRLSGVSGLATARNFCHPFEKTSTTVISLCYITYFVFRCMVSHLDPSHLYQIDWLGYSDHVSLGQEQTCSFWKSQALLSLTKWIGGNIKKAPCAWWIHSNGHAHHRFLAHHYPA